MPRNSLFPEITPYHSGSLVLDDLHTMYWEESGNPKGIPVLFLHGGPGAGTSGWQRQFFDPSAYRIVLFDQRGAGRSTPLGELRENSPTHLVDDIEKLRKLLNIEKWLIFGGSWGSTLALLYAQSHPGHCLGLILRGIFLFRQIEIDWFLYGIRSFFPENWEVFTKDFTEAEKTHLLDHYHQRLFDKDAEVYMKAARTWSRYEGSCATLLPDEKTVAHFASDTVALGLARTEAHFFKYYEMGDRLLENMDCIRHLPTIIVQGRYDMCCPPQTAYELKKAWPEAEFIWIKDAGHAASEPGILVELVKACEKMKGLFTS